MSGSLIQRFSMVKYFNILCSLLLSYLAFLKQGSLKSIFSKKTSHSNIITKPTVRSAKGARNMKCEQNTLNHVDALHPSVLFYLKPLSAAKN